MNKNTRTWGTYQSPNYAHVPTMAPEVHRHIDKAFGNSLAKLKEVIRDHGFHEHVEVSLLHKHGNIKDGLAYVEYFKTNHMLQVVLSLELIDKLDIATTPYSFYFRDGEVHAYEVTVESLAALEYPTLTSDFVAEYGRTLRECDTEGVFGYRLNYKSRLLGSPRLVEYNINDVSLTSLKSLDLASDTDVSVRTAWSAKDAAECCSCHHCWGHPICHPHGCVKAAPLDELIYPIYEKIRARLQIEDLEHRFGSR